MNKYFYARSNLVTYTKLHFYQLKSKLKQSFYIIIIIHLLQDINNSTEINLQVALSSDFLSLPKSEVLEILSHDELYVTSEEQVNEI